MSLSAPISIDTDEIGQRVIVLTYTQLAALRETLSLNVDLDTVALDNGEPDRADFIREFVEVADSAL